MVISGVTLGDAMTAPVLTIEVGESLWDAWQMLVVSGLRHMAVIDADRAFVGIVSDRMILANAPLTAESLGSRTVGELLPNVPTFSLNAADSPVTAARLMSKRSLEAAGVLDSRGKLIGIVTEADLVRWLLAA